MASKSSNQWECGTPKSQGNAFDLSVCPGELSAFVVREQLYLSRGFLSSQRNNSHGISIDPNPADSRAKSARILKAQI